jgi:hypothetical protein
MNIEYLKGHIVEHRETLYRWIEQKEAFVWKRMIQDIQDTSLFPLMIIQKMDLSHSFSDPTIKYYLFEYDYQWMDPHQWFQDDMFSLLQKRGFVNPCLSKDDHPIFVKQNNII